MYSLPQKSACPCGFVSGTHSVQFGKAFSCRCFLLQFTRKKYVSLNFRRFEICTCFSSRSYHFKTNFTTYFDVFSTVHHSIELFHQPTLMDNFLYSLTICLLHYYPRHVSSINIRVRSQPVYCADVYRERRYQMLCEYNFSS